MRLSFCLPVVVLCVISVLAVAAPPASPATAPATAPAAAAKADVTISAADLVKEYGADAAAADAKYKGKVLEVSGFVVAAGSPAAGTAFSPDPNYFMVGGSEDANLLFSTLVRCYVTKEDSMRCDVLSQKQTITIRGTCAGAAKSEMGSQVVDLKEVSIVKTGDDPAIKVSASDLAAAYIKDEKEAAQKYGGAAMIIVEGTVQKFDDENHNVYLDAGKTADGKPLTMKFTIAAAFWASAKKHAAGKPIAIKGEVADLKGNELSGVFGLVMP